MSETIPQYQIRKPLPGLIHINDFRRYAASAVQFFFSEWALRSEISPILYPKEMKFEQWINQLTHYMDGFFSSENFQDNQ